MNRDATVRVTLYALIAMVATLTQSLGELTPDALSKMIWPQWATMCLSPILSALVATRAFMDRSLTRKPNE